jgi:hypothetical protein
MSIHRLNYPGSFEGYYSRVGTLWRCGDGLFFELIPLTSDALLTTLHPLLENVNGII